MSRDGRNRDDAAGSPAIFARLFERTWRGETAARVGDEHINGPEHSLDFEARPLDIGVLRDIGFDADRAPAGTFDVRLNLCERWSIPSVYGDLCAVLSK